MREVKFRQKLDSGGFHYWGFTRYGQFVGPMTHNGTKEAHENSQEYTGLHDNNGKEIYEGDIIQRYQDEIFEVRWEELQSGFGVYIGVLKPRSHWRELYKFLDFEIIGNIYENPELLSVKSNV